MWKSTSCNTCWSILTIIWWLFFFRRLLRITLLLKPISFRLIRAFFKNIFLCFSLLWEYFFNCRLRWRQLQGHRLLQLQFWFKEQFLRSHSIICSTQWSITKEVSVLNIWKWIDYPWDLTNIVLISRGIKSRQLLWRLELKWRHHLTHSRCPKWSKLTAGICSKYVVIVTNSIREWW